MRYWFLAVCLIGCRSTAPQPAEQRAVPAAPQSGTSVPSATGTAAPPVVSASTDPIPPAEADGVAVIISAHNLIVEEAVVALVPATRELAAKTGFDAKYKQPGNDLLIVPMAEALDKWVDARRKSPTSAGLREAMVIADMQTPYRLLSEVLYTIGQKDIARFHLMILQSGKPIRPPPDAPALPTLAGRGPTPVNLVVAITERGVVFKTNTGGIGPGCKEGVPGLTAPNAGANLDVPAIQQCARHLKAADPAETHVTIAANAGIEYAKVIALMDALRSDSAGPLFPDEVFAAFK